ncbi:MAG: ABC transporter permease subunit [Gemmatimonadetes bacterium]|nr:ABC transporter permease subunit [Gemmatimonadota bacterium]NIQ59141.1 ABC transporter permease subunit [Gemmatimonadota bacterium]NIU79345.1 ABC transporter permease subunit [Gammaproteobacteria bacterium]NIX48013.1 ABC transporter permease subunit [Gemmatimonadota bacterium]NIY12384.1 ABC transporter permease subunit [Gemmatimonadota bacterium]
MSRLGAALGCEVVKVRRSRVPPLTALGFSLGPLAAGLFMVIMKDPARAREWGLISTKAQVFAGAADWPTFLSVVGQTVAIGGWLLFALLTAWVFGREFADRTARTVLAVPTPRWATVLAKLLVVAAMSALLAVWAALLGLGIGAVIGLPGGSAAVLLDGVAKVAMAATLTIALLPPIALAASAGRGYMAPLGLALLLLFLAQVVAATGWGEWFPWAVPALLAGLAGPDAAALGPWSFALVAAVAVAGTAATVAWWRLADHVT